MTALPAYAAIGLSVLVAAASGSGDYELVTIPPAPEPICAKSYETCNAAANAISKFGLFSDLHITEMWCVPAPSGCFPAVGLTIKGHNDR